MTYTLNYIHFLFLSTSEESPSSSCLERLRAKQYTLDLQFTQEGQEIIREAPSRMIKKGQVILSPLFPPSPSTSPTALAPPSQTPQPPLPPAPQTSSSTHSHRVNRGIRTLQPHLPLTHRFREPPPLTILLTFSNTTLYPSFPPSKCTFDYPPPFPNQDSQHES